MQGGLLAMVVILLFLVGLPRHRRSCNRDPAPSIVATFILLYFTRQTLNVFTMGGLALGVGRLVDG